MLNPHDEACLGALESCVDEGLGTDRKGIRSLTSRNCVDVKTAEGLRFHWVYVLRSRSG